MLWAFSDAVGSRGRTREARSAALDMPPAPHSAPPDPSPGAALHAHAESPIPPGALTSIEHPLGPLGKAIVAVLLVGVGLGAVAYVHQLRVGLAATGLSDSFSWGVYVVNFVFFIGVSMAGTLISALLRLSNAEWRRPITRLAEAITVFALLIAAPMIVIDMGRPDRLLYVFLHGRVQSPILWDVLSLTTYLAGSVLYLYVPMIPDLAILRDRAGAGVEMKAWRRRLYAMLALGWRGSPEQARLLHRAIAILAVVIIPVAISIHTVTAWLFGMTLRPGWHSTIIGPDFVVGALYSGMAAVITAIAVFRYAFALSAVITREHFMRLGFLLVVFGILYGYFMVNEYLGAGYVGPTSENEHIRELLHGRFAAAFWVMAGVGLIIPVGVLLVPRFRTVRWIVAMAVLVNVGMWLKRYIIIVPTLATPFMPLPPTELGKTLVYRPTWVEWSITAGAFAMFALLYLGFARLFPLVSLWELAESPPSAGAENTPPERVQAGSVPAAASKASALVVMLAAMMVGLGLSGPARAQQPPTTEAKSLPVARVVLSVTTEENRRMLVATVTRDEKPVEGAKVRFAVRRTFGTLVLGEEATLDDGTAAVPFPEGLPGDATGALAVIGEVVSPAELVASRAEQSLRGGTPAAGDTGGLPRALWAPRAPLGFIVAVGSIVGIVWLSYIVVIRLLWRIWKERTGHPMRSGSIKVPVASALLVICGGALAILVLAGMAQPGKGTDAAPWVAPSRAAKKANPIPADAKSLELGKKLWNRDCLSCHGAKGLGDGPKAADLERKVTSLVDPAVWDQTDGALFWKLVEGKAPMPATKTLMSDDERWHVINYMRTLAPPEATPVPPQFAAPERLRKAVSDTLRTYDGVRAALAGKGDVAAAAKAAPALVDAIAAMDKTDTKGAAEDAVKMWHEDAGACAKAAETLKAAGEDPAKQRAAFASLSSALQRTVEFFGHAEPGPVFVFVGTKGPEAQTWLQTDAKPLTPYADAGDNLVPTKRLAGQRK